MTTMRTRRALGVTLIEVLLVIAIIGLLFSLMVPAIQSSREAGRRTACTNNLRQFGVAFSEFQAQTKAFPSSFTMQVRGPLETDPAFDAYTFFVDLLPFLEEQSVRDQYHKDAVFCAPQNQAAIAHDLPVAICPSSPDRASRVKQQYLPSTFLPTGGGPKFNAIFAELDKKYGTSYIGGASDYAVPDQVEDGLANMYGYTVKKNAAAGLRSMFPSPLNIEVERLLLGIASVMKSSGTVSLSAQTRPSQISDGLSHTMMMTEVAGRPQHWEMGMHTGRLDPLPSAWADPACVVFNIRGIHIDDKTKCVLGCANTSEGDGEIYSFHDDGASFLFADGHVDFVSATTDQRVIFAWITPDKGDGQQ